MQCEFCGHLHEDFNHLFIKCPTAKLITQSVNHKAHPAILTCNPNIYNPTAIIQELRKKVDMDTMSKLVFIWWSIWYFRNQIIFRNEAENIQGIINFIKNQIHNWGKTKSYSEEMEEIIGNKTNKSASETRRKKKGIKWEKPPPGVFKLNFDGSRLDSGKTSIGFIIRDSNARTVAIQAASCNFESVIGAEATAVYLGIKKAIQLKIQNLEIEGDNMCIINALKGT